MVAKFLWEVIVRRTMFDIYFSVANGLNDHKLFQPRVRELFWVNFQVGNSVLLKQVIESQESFWLHLGVHLHLKYAFRERDLSGCAVVECFEYLVNK